MAKVVAAPLPDNALLLSYRERRAYSDAFTVDLPLPVTLEAYIAAFYTIPLFKLERLVLAAIGKPSSDAEARRLAKGENDRFAAWTVEARDDGQILMCDFMRKTRSWLKCEAIPGGTRLWFGSAIVPKHIQADGRVDLGLMFHLLLPFHRLYSVALLGTAAHRLGAK
ncbi:MAG: hypothetical protein JF615_02720 [Asticcacaulis sp.]|nr:hypothetical protein [Asticcacaulis sp.]